MTAIANRAYSRIVNDGKAGNEWNKAGRIAELELLERYDVKRRFRGHDYGSGQRRAELGRRRRELGYLNVELGDSSTVDLIEAWQRIGRPRAQRESFGGTWVDLLDELVREYGVTDEVLRHIVVDYMRRSVIASGIEALIARLELECDRLRDGTLIESVAS